MNAELDARERALVDRLNAYVRSAVHPRAPESVVNAVLAHRPLRRVSFPRIFLMPAMAIVVVAMVGVVAISYLGVDRGSSPATAFVDGVEYNLAAARSLHLPSDVLEPYGSVTRLQADPAQFEDLTAYAVRGVDPATLLVMKLKPDARDDSGTLGEVFLLVRGPDAFRDLCPYFDPASDATPRDCR